MARAPGEVIKMDSEGQASSAWGEGGDGMRKTEPEKGIPKFFARVARRIDQIKCSQTLKHDSAKRGSEQWGDLCRV